MSRSIRLVRAAAGALIPASILVVHGPRDRARIALTIDDGPTELTRAYLDVLDEHGARATFFLVGGLCERRPDHAHEIVSRGHEVGNHGYSHRPFAELSRRELVEELERTAELLPPRGAGRPLVRPPRGELSLPSLVSCARAGFRVVLWSRDSDDWMPHSASRIASDFERRGVSPGDVVLMHDGQTATLGALASVLSNLGKAGHELVTISELVA